MRSSSLCALLAGLLAPAAALACGAFDPNEPPRVEHPRTDGEQVATNPVILLGAQPYLMRTAADHEAAISLREVDAQGAVVAGGSTRGVRVESFGDVFIARPVDALPLGMRFGLFFDSAGQMVRLRWFEVVDVDDTVPRVVGVPSVRVSDEVLEPICGQPRQRRFELEALASNEPPAIFLIREDGRPLTATPGPSAAGRLRCDGQTEPGLVFAAAGTHEITVAAFDASGIEHEPVVVSLTLPPCDAAQVVQPRGGCATAPGILIPAVCAWMFSLRRRLPQGRVRA